MAQDGTFYEGLRRLADKSGKDYSDAVIKKFAEEHAGDEIAGYKKIGEIMGRNYSDEAILKYSKRYTSSKKKEETTKEETTSPSQLPSSESPDGQPSQEPSAPPSVEETPEEATQDLGSLLDTQDIEVPAPVDVDPEIGVTKAIEEGTFVPPPEEAPHVSVDEYINRYDQYTDAERTQIESEFSASEIDDLIRYEGSIAEREQIQRRDEQRSDVFNEARVAMEEAKTAKHDRDVPKNRQAAQEAKEKFGKVPAELVEWENTGVEQSFDNIPKPKVAKPGDEKSDAFKYLTKEEKESMGVPVNATEESLSRGAAAADYNIKLANEFKYLTTEERAELVEKLALRGDFDAFIKEDASFIDKILEMIGGQAPALVLGMANPALAPLIASGLQGASAEVASFKGYLDQGKKAGMDGEELIKKASAMSQISKQHAWMEGFIGMVNPFAGKGAKLFTKAAFKAADVSMDAGAAAMAQLIENDIAKAQDFPVETWEGVAENAGAEALFSILASVTGLPGAVKSSFLAKAKKNKNLTKADLIKVKAQLFEPLANTIAKITKDKQGGQTFDIEGKIVDPNKTNKDVVSVRTKVVDTENLQQDFNDFIDENKGVIEKHSDKISIGTFVMTTGKDKGKTVLNINVMTDPDLRNENIKFAKGKGLEAIFSYKKKGGQPEGLISTGAEVVDPKDATDAEIDKIVQINRKQDDIKAKKRAKLNAERKRRRAHEQKIKDAKEKEKRVSAAREGTFDEVEQARVDKAGREALEEPASVSAASTKDTKGAHDIEWNQKKPVQKIANADGEIIGFIQKNEKGEWETYSPVGFRTVTASDKQAAVEQHKEQRAKVDTILKIRDERENAERAKIRGEQDIAKKKEKERRIQEEETEKIGKDLKVKTDDGKKQKVSVEVTPQGDYLIYDGSKRRSAEKILASNDPKWAGLKEEISRRIEHHEKNHYDMTQNTLDVAQDSDETIEKRITDREQGRGGIVGAISEAGQDIFQPKQSETELEKDAVDRLTMFQRYEQQGKHDKAEAVLATVTKDLTSFSRVMRIWQLGEFKNTTSGMTRGLVKFVESGKRESKVTKQQKDIIRAHVKTINDAKKEMTKLKNKAVDDPDNFTMEDFHRYEDLDQASKDARVKVSIFTGKIRGDSMIDVWREYVRGALLSEGTHITNIAGNITHLIPRMIAKLYKPSFGEMWAGARGAFFGFKQGFKDMWTGNYIMDNTKFDQSIQIASLHRWRDLFAARMNMKEFFERPDMRRDKSGKVTKGTKVAVGLEMVFGLAPDATFRILRLGDQGFKAGAREAQIYRSIKDLDGKGLKNMKEAYMHKFQMEAKLESMRKQAATLKDPKAASQAEAEVRKLQDKLSGFESDVHKAEGYAIFDQDSPIAEFAKHISKMPSKLIRPLADMATRGGKERLASGLVTTGKIAETILFPFVKIPANLIGMGIDIVIPVNPMMKILKGAQKGNTREVREGITSLIMTVAVYTFFNAYGDAVNITTKRDEFKRHVRDIKKEVGPRNGVNFSAIGRARDGHPDPYRELPDDFVVSFEKLGPIGVALAMLAAGRDVRNRTKPVEDEGQELFAKAMYETSIKVPQVMEGLGSATQMSMLTSVDNAARLIAGEGGAGYNAANMARTILSPFNPALMRQPLVDIPKAKIPLDARDMKFWPKMYNDFVNEHFLSVRGDKENVTYASEEMIQNNPGAAEDLPFRKTNVWAEYLPEKGAWTVLSPLKNHRGDIDLTTSEILRVGEVEGSMGFSYPTRQITVKVRRKDGTIKKQALTMTRTDLRDTFMDAQARKKVKYDNMMLEYDFDGNPTGNLDPWWESLSDEKKQEKIKKISSSVNEEVKDKKRRDLQLKISNGDIKPAPDKTLGFAWKNKPWVYEYPEVEE
jgi:hypothetical protein